MSTRQLLFSTPITISDAPELFKEDHNFLINSEYHWGSNKEFLSTKNNFILKGREDTPLVRWINEQITDFTLNSMATMQQLRITQSWCLKHEPRVPQHVFMHSHPNSIISGAYYVYAPLQTQSIKFHKGFGGSFPFNTWDYDDGLLKEQPWAWEWHQVPVQTGRLVLFPSNLQHSVGPGEGYNMRCVLSFNTWFQGEFGSREKLTALGGDV